MKILLRILLTFVGAGVGLVLAGLATFYGCVLIDKVQGNGPGSGYGSVGWIFLFLTLPAGALVGGGAAFLTTVLIQRRKAARDGL